MASSRGMECVRYVDFILSLSPCQLREEHRNIGAFFVLDVHDVMCIIVGIVMDSSAFVAVAEASKDVV